MKKKNKGFTLVELLAVLSLISVILIVAVPGIISIGNKMRSKATDEKIEMLKKAATSYMLKHKNYCIKNNTADSSSSYYECKIKAGELVDLGGYEKEYDPHNDCKVYSPDDYSCLDDLDLSVRLKKASEKASDAIQHLAPYKPENPTDIITSPAPEGATCTNTLAYDGTPDDNLRYVGADPCNYATFNGESPTISSKWLVRNISTGDLFERFDTKNECTSSLQTNYGSDGYDCIQKNVVTGGWRIIGLMNNIDNGKGSKEKRIKLVRNEFLGTYSWNSASSDINSGYGVNDWAQSVLMQELNGDYLNTGLNANTTWYNGSKNKKEAVYDYTKGLKASAQSLIEDATWNIGGYKYDPLNFPASSRYEQERGNMTSSNTAGGTCVGNCPYPTTWTGKVALLYPSDIQYSIGGNNRTVCLNEWNWEFLNAGPVINPPCTRDVWLMHPTCDEFSVFYTTRLALLTPIATNNYSVTYFWTDTGEGAGAMRGFLSSETISNTKSVLPVVYLKSSVIKSGGDGSPENPYTFS